MSNYCRNIANYYSMKISTVNKLVQNLDNKSKYVIHYRNLQSYLSLGMKLTKLHRILKFNQSWLAKKHIDFKYRQKKKNAANSFEKDFLKLQNNSIYVKTTENLRKRLSVLIINAKNYKNYVSFVSQKNIWQKFTYCSWS